MRHLINIMVATSCSMIVAFGFHCALDQAILTDSLFQRIALDLIRHNILFYRCVLYEERSQEGCDYMLTMFNEELLYICLLLMIICLICILAWFYGNQVFHYFRIILFTMWAVDFLVRYADFVGLRYQIDVLTVYLFVWQFIFLVWNWQIHELFSPVVIIEQASFCIFTAFVSFIAYDIIYRYIPFKINLLWFWFMSVGDIFLTLHSNGWIRNLFTNYKFMKSKEIGLHNPYEIDNIIIDQSDRSSYFSKFFIKCVANESEGNLVPCCYYTEGVANGGDSLGLGDFFVYNILLLLLLPLFSSTETKLWVTFGFIVSMAIGQLGTHYLHNLWNPDNMPGLPLPVICFSTYILFLNDIMSSSEECIHLEDIVNCTYA